MTEHLSTICGRLVALLRIDAWPSASMSLAGSLILFSTTSSADPSAHTTAKFMGTGSCSSSNCHGGVNPLSGSTVLQNEYHTWQKLDRHAQAYSVLLNDDSKKIANHLGIERPEAEPLCLKCHATYVPSVEQQGPKYQVEDGVSCESCHNPSEHWLKSHSTKGATHEENVKNGLAELVPLEKRATLCLSCHFGTEDKTVNHRLYGAGHPRLAFELDTFGVLQPKHWVIDEDYRTRKADYVPVAAWLVGQTTHAIATLEALESPTRSKHGLMPELSLFDCYSCHHSLTEDQWKQRDYSGKPGELTLNLPSLYILREALPALDSDLADELKDKLSELHNFSTSPSTGGDIRSVTSPLKALLHEKILPLALAAQSDATYCKKLLKQLATFGAHSGALKYEVAEQVGMGMQALLASSPDLATKHKGHLDVVFAALKSSEAFNTASFTEGCKKLASSL